MARKEKTAGLSAKKRLHGALMRKNRLLLIAAIALVLLDCVAELAISLILGWVTDAVTASDLSRLWNILWFTAADLAAIAVFSCAAQAVKARYVRRGIENYKAEAFLLLTEKGVSAFDAENTGTYLSMLTLDAGTIEENCLNRVPLILFYAVQFVLTLGLMLWISPILTLIAVGLCLLPILVTVAMSPEMAKREKTVSDGSERFTAEVKDLLGGFSVLKSFRAEDRARGLFGSENESLERGKERRRRYAGILSGTGSIAGGLVQIGILFIAGLFTIRGRVTLGSAIIILNLCNYLVSPIRIVPEYFASYKAAKGIIEKHADLLTRHAEEAGEPVPKTLTRGIEARALSFGYAPDAPVLSDLNFSLNAGGCYALVGGSGAGKTTLLRLLLGALRGYEGSLTLDGAEVDKADPVGLNELIAPVDQNVFLFDATIRENITLFGDFPPERVQDAAERAGLLSVLAARGEEYRCGENGRNLSGGERQRISIARAILRGANVLLFDEATSALDPETARHVLDALLSLDGMTRIVVTHRLEAATLRGFDAVLMLKNGRIAEAGRFDDLMERKGAFYALYTVSAA